MQPLLEMTLKLKDFIGVQECTPEDVTVILQEVLESMGAEVAGSGIKFSDLQVQFLTVGTQLEIDLQKNLSSG